MPDLDFIKVTGRFGLTVGDGPDPDETPDTIWCDEGQVRLVPLNTYTKVAGGAPKPWTAGHSVIDTAIDVNGYISWSGQPYVWMVDLTSDKVNPKVSPGKATHRVEFRNVRAGGVPVSFETQNVRLAADTVVDGVCDLTLLMPVPTGGGTPIVVGPQGVSIEDASITGPGHLELALSDGSTLDAGLLPVGPGGSDAGVAGYVGTPGSATETAVATKIATATAPKANTADVYSKTAADTKFVPNLAPDWATVLAAASPSTPYIAQHNTDSFEAYEAIRTLGARMFDCDTGTFLADGGLGLYHDTDLGPRTTLTGTMLETDSATFRSGKMQPSRYLGSGANYPDVPLRTLQEWLSAYPNDLLSWEAKSLSVGAGIAAIQAAKAEKRSMIALSSSQLGAAGTGNAAQVKAAGIKLTTYISPPGSIGTQLPLIVAANPDLVGIRKDATQAQIDQVKAALPGVPLYTWGTLRRNEKADAIAKGFSALFVEDYSYLARTTTTAIQNKSTFANRIYQPGHVNSHQRERNRWRSKFVTTTYLGFSDWMELNKTHEADDGTLTTVGVTTDLQGYLGLLPATSNWTIDLDYAWVGTIPVLTSDFFEIALCDNDGARDPSTFNAGTSALQFRSRVSQKRVYVASRTASTEISGSRVSPGTTPVVDTIYHSTLAYVASTGTYTWTIGPDVLTYVVGPNAGGGYLNIGHAISDPSVTSIRYRNVVRT